MNSAMDSRNRLGLVVIASALLFVCLFGALSTPFLVANGLRLWLWWKARQEHFLVEIDKVEAPFLRPVVLRGFRLSSDREAGFRLTARAPQIAFGLNLKAILFRGGERALRNLSTNGLQIEIRGGTSAQRSLSEAGWRTLQRLLPGSFDLRRADLRLETGRTVVLLRNVAVSGNEIESGRFAADQLMFVSPWFRQSFSGLRGATKWEENRLTIAGLSLTSGLDLAALTGDLSQIGRQIIGLNFDAEVFGGRVRVEISHERAASAPTWNVVGSAGNISLVETAEALGFTERVGGSLHAASFTFRGNLADPTQATGWVWTELSTPAWRDRAADVLMFGATLADRQIHIQQVYVQQGPNEFTLHGQSSIPSSWSNWLSTNFSGDISAQIVELRDFAGLCGAKRDDFSGALTVEGTVNAKNRSITGQFTATGSALTLFRQPVGLLAADAALRGTTLDLQHFNLVNGRDFLEAQGKIDISHPQDFSGNLALSLRNVADYVSTATESALEGQLVFDGGCASIASLQLHDNSLHVDFGGTADLASLRDVSFTFVPSQALFDLGHLSESDCASRVQFFTAEEAQKSLPRIERIDLRGDLLNATWRIGLGREIGPDQEWRLCANGNGQPLNLAVRDETNPAAARSAERNSRTREQRTVSVTANQP